MGKKILFYGDIAVDIIVEAGQQPDTGQDAAVDELNTLPGGSSANTAVIAGHLKQDATIMGLIGDDLYRDLLLRDLSAHKVHLDLLREVPGKNTLVIAIINADGEKTFYSYRGVNARADFGGIPEDLTAGFDAVHISGYCMQDATTRATTLALINTARRTGTPLTLDPSHLFAASDYGRSSSLLSNFEVIFPNLEEAQAMTGEKEVERASAKLRQYGPKNCGHQAGSGRLLSYRIRTVRCIARLIKLTGS